MECGPESGVFAATVCFTRSLSGSSLYWMRQRSLIYQTSLWCHESQRLNDCSVFVLRGLSVGHRSNARNEPKSHRGKKQTQKTLMLLCSVWKPSEAAGQRRKRKEEEDRLRIRGKREAGEGVIK